MNDALYMERALELAETAASEGEVPVGAVIVRNSDGLIAGTGYNSREKSRSALAHAEISAIGKACETLGGWRLEGCTMYVTLEPCPMCAGAAINARLGRIVFGAYDRRAGACGSVTDLFSSGFDSTAEITGGFMEERSAELLKRFFEELRGKRKKYRLTPVSTDDQLMRAASAANISPRELSCGDAFFIRRKALPVGIVYTSGDIKRMIIFDEYKNTDLSGIAEILEENGG